MSTSYSRMVYASKATFKPFKPEDSIDREIDDILTTGTTAHHAALALRRGGARCVSVAVLAVVSETVDRFD